MMLHHGHDWGVAQFLRLLLAQGDLAILLQSDADVEHLHTKSEGQGDTGDEGEGQGYTGDEG